MQNRSSQIIDWKTLVSIVLLASTIFLASFLLIKGWYVYLLIVVPVIIWQLANLYKAYRKLYTEVSQFVDAVEYRDFSRHFDETNAPVALKALRQSFNQINATIRTLHKEKEAQDQYIHKILDLVNTGILSYEEKEGDVIWMNESLQKLLLLPYLKKIHALEKRNEVLYNEIINLKLGEMKVITVKLERDSLKILAAATSFQTDGKTYKLIAFQNVSDALDETESEAWQKLLSVLTHEIMNSIAPISSLAETLKDRLQKVLVTSGETAQTEDIVVGMDTIKKRSEGLLKFARTYRTLNTVSPPNVKKMHVSELLENIYRLMQPTLQQKNIEFDINLKETDITVEVDEGLIEQVLINLIVNAIEAVKDKANPKIAITGFISSSKKPTIKVADNGKGISAEILDKIFIPFFSTKKNGSGIGLSLCKQIMLLHKGNIQVISEPDAGTAFVLTFGNM